MSACSWGKCLDRSFFFCVWEHEPPLAAKSENPNVSQLSVLTSFQLSWFHARSHYRPDKTVTLSNICLLIIHSAGGQMAPSSYSLAPALINQFLQQLWVIADALKFNSLLYEVRRFPHYVKESNRWANCLFFFNKPWTQRDLCAYSTPPPPGTSKLKHVGAEQIKSSSCSVDPDFHTSNKQEHPIRNCNLLTW